MPPFEWLFLSYRSGMICSRFVGHNHWIQQLLFAFCTLLQKLMGTFDTFLLFLCENSWYPSRKELVKGKFLGQDHVVRSSYALDLVSNVIWNYRRSAPLFFVTFIELFIPSTHMLNSYALLFQKLWLTDNDSVGENRIENKSGNQKLDALGMKWFCVLLI